MKTNEDVMSDRNFKDLNSSEETMYLLSCPKNANRLMESIAQLKAGKVHTKELIRNENK